MRPRLRLRPLLALIELACLRVACAAHAHSIRGDCSKHYGEARGFGSLYLQGHTATYLFASGSPSDCVMRALTNETSLDSLASVHVVIVVYRIGQLRTLSLCVCVFNFPIRRK